MGLDLETFDAADYLTDAESIAIYLTDALESGSTEEFTNALADVVRARGGMAKLSMETGLPLPALQSTFDDTGRPDFLTIFQILQAFGVRLTTTVVEAPALAA